MGYLVENHFRADGCKMIINPLGSAPRLEVASPMKLRRWVLVYLMTGSSSLGGQSSPTTAAQWSVLALGAAAGLMVAFR